MDEDPRAPSPSSAPGDFGSRVTTLAALAEPVRRRLYQFVAGRSEGVTRDQAAEGIGVARHVAKFHLDRLVDDGLCDFEYRRPPGRRGPGAGRPAKVYRRATGEVAVSVPERHYDLAGRLFAEAITRSEAEHRPVQECLRRAARTTGRSVGRSIVARTGATTDPAALRHGIAAELDGWGYEPREEAGSIVLRNCPFHSLSALYTDLVCGMNLDLMEGLLEPIEGSGLLARLEPVDGQCCVRLEAQ